MNITVTIALFFAICHTYVSVGWERIIEIRKRVVVRSLYVATNIAVDILRIGNIDFLWKTTFSNIKKRNGNKIFLRAILMCYRLALGVV